MKGTLPLESGIQKSIQIIENNKKMRVGYRKPASQRIISQGNRNPPVLGDGLSRKNELSVWETEEVKNRRQ